MNLVQVVQIAFPLGVGLVVVGTSVWVLIDARRLGMRRTERNMLSNSPATWFIGCLLLWAIAFPLYLVARAEHLRASGGGAGGGGGGGSGTPQPAGVARATGAVAVGAPGNAWMGGVSLGLGAASIVLGPLVGIFSAPLWLGGAVLGIVALSTRAPNRRLAVAGVITSAAGFLAMVVTIVVVTMLALRA
ncbi:MAG: hypothetical protein SFY69_09615 [Planctomycetota bacterium]|nr:hypothetical protein [Planctomycetota bacterium]